MSYDENDAAQDAFYEQMYEQFHREHADEIADEVTTGEVLSAILLAHGDWWILAQAALAKGHRRLADGDFEEVLFHVGRAFDGYVKNVLVTPLRAALVERFQRFMPEGFPIKPDHLFKSISGLGSAGAFAEYSVSLLSSTNAEAQALISEFRALVTGAEAVGPTWRDRDRAFHAPIAVDAMTAEALLRAAEHILRSIVVSVDRHLLAAKIERERFEFSQTRMLRLQYLVKMTDRDPETRVRLWDIPSTYGEIEEREDTLRTFMSSGYVECKVDGDGRFAKKTYRVTMAGREYYEASIIPRLPTKLRG